MPCCCSVANPCPALCNHMDCSTPGFSVLHCLPELTQLMSIQFLMPSNHLILCCPFLLLPSIFPSIRVFSNELSLCIRWPKYWSFSVSFSMSSSNEYSGLISFKIDWFYLLAVWGTLKSLLQHHNLKASALVLSFLYGRICLQCGRPGFDPWKKEMITHSNILTWRIPWTMSLAGYSSWGWKESNMTEQVTLY